MKLSPYQVAAFTQTARAGSFSAAAEALGVTQSSITQHVQKLEKSMGTRLFVRRHDGVELTHAGRDLFEVSDRLLVLEELVAEKVATYGAVDAGTLRIVANAPRPAMPLIRRYLETYPGVEVEFSLYDWTTTRSMVRNREVDLAIITDPDPPAGATVIKLDATAYMAHMRREHRLAAQNNVSLGDLQGEHLIVPEDGSLTQIILNRKIAGLKLALPNIIKTRTFPVVKEAVLHGIGIGLIVEDSLFPSTGLVAKPIVEMPELYEHCLVIPSDKSDLRAIQRFIEISQYQG
ncbi:MAG: LysR family transcriptional regulator [Pseudomonadota bacterium]